MIIAAEPRLRRPDEHWANCASDVRLVWFEINFARKDLGEIGDEVAPELKFSSTPQVLPDGAGI
jgi:hypothetical protein